MSKKWLCGWYATRLHAVDESARDLGYPVKSMCGAYVYLKPPTFRAEKRFNKGLPKCKRCLKRIAEGAE